MSSRGSQRDDVVVGDGGARERLELEDQGFTEGLSGVAGCGHCYISLAQTDQPNQCEMGRSIREVACLGSDTGSGREGKRKAWLG